MPDYVTCFSCENEPTQQCSRCGRPYCDDHGEELCDICMQPGSGVPSFNLYRGSMLALLVGTVLTVWFLLQPSSGSGDTAGAPLLVTPTSTTAQNQPTQEPGATQPPATQQPGTTATPAATATAPAATATTGTGTPAATATPTTAAGGGGTYTVAPGDTIFGICLSERPSMDPIECVDEIKTLNSLPSDDLATGDTLRLP